MPLTDKLKKKEFVWDSAASKSFEELKALLTSAPILVCPNFMKHVV